MNPMTTHSLLSRLLPLMAALSLCFTAALDAAAQGTATLTVRARGSLAGGVGPTMQVRVNGAIVGAVEVRATDLADYSFTVPALAAGAKVDLVFTNDAVIAGADRNLYIAYVSSGANTVLPTMPGAIFDRGDGAKAFDGVDTMPGRGELYWSGALRLAWPAAPYASPFAARMADAARFLQQASFGPSNNDLMRLVQQSYAVWIDQQVAQPATPDFVSFVQGKYALGDDYRPQGSKYTNSWVAQRFWGTAAAAPDQLRRRMAFALQEMMVISQVDSNLYFHSRAHASYLDALNRNALGNFRTLLEDVALSPAMGIYLSHMRNRKEDPATGRVPDENFAREVMQLFTIGLYELNADGSVKTDAAGKPIETYSNLDVMALARVFTGWSWAFPDAELTEHNFRYGGPEYTRALDRSIDLLRMRAYPGQHSTSEKRLFAGKPWAVTLPAGNSAEADLRAALDALFNHPNTAPFLARQLIQHLVTSDPSPAYVARVAAQFNNNGKGVRGDLAAVARAILLDTEARNAPAPNFGKLREPILRVTQWMRSLGATSATGEYMMAYELDGLSQRALNPPSVFSWFRPGYVPPNTRFAVAHATAPEFQLVNESTTANWVNLAESMAGGGLGWTGSARDVTTRLDNLVALASAGDVGGLLQQLNLLLFAGAMSPELKRDILDAIGGVGGSDAASQLNRARVAVFVALASPEYLVQR